jgi:hypothetical protein
LEGCKPSKNLSFPDISGEAADVLEKGTFAAAKLPQIPPPVTPVKKR